MAAAGRIQCLAKGRVVFLIEGGLLQHLLRAMTDGALQFAGAEVAIDARAVAIGKGNPGQPGTEGQVKSPCPCIRLLGADRYLTQGRAAGEALGRRAAPVDAAIVGIIDRTDIEQ